LTTLFQSLTMGHNQRLIAPSKLFQPCLIFVIKAGSERCTFQVIPYWPANIRLGLKRFVRDKHRLLPFHQRRRKKVILKTFDTCIAAKSRGVCFITFISVRFFFKLGAFILLLLSLQCGTVLLKKTICEKPGSMADLKNYSRYFRKWNCLFKLTLN